MENDDFCLEFALAKIYRVAGVTGATIKLDQNGDSEGNFSVLALKPYQLVFENFSCDHHMMPVGQFQQSDHPVSELAFNLFEI